MEKLLLLSQTKGGNHATNLTSQHIKNIFLAFKGTKIFFAHTRQTTW